EQDVVLVAVLDQIPHDQEVTREIQPLDQVELALDLLPRLLDQRSGPIPTARAALAQIPQKANRRLSRRQRVIGKAIAEVLQREPQPQRELAGIGDGLGAVEEQALHRSAVLHEMLAVQTEPSAGLGDRGVLADARQHIEERPIATLDETRGVAGDQRRANTLRFRAQPLVERFLSAVEMA